MPITIIIIMCVTDTQVPGCIQQEQQQQNTTAGINWALFGPQSVCPSVDMQQHIIRRAVRKWCKYCDCRGGHAPSVRSAGGQHCDFTIFSRAPRTNLFTPILNIVKRTISILHQFHRNPGAMWAAQRHLFRFTGGRLICPQCGRE